MIGKLKGIVETIEESSIILDVSGVGYHVFCSGNSLSKLPEAGREAVLFIETHVREDHIHLFGFTTVAEKQAFNTLLKVNGVGVKMALAILSVLTPSAIAAAIASEDKAAFSQVSGVGPKLASRIITELKDKFSVDTVTDFSISVKQHGAPIRGDNINDAVSALANLGYSRSDSYNIINKIAAGNDNLELDFLIREGLKELGKGR